MAQFKKFMDVNQVARGKRLTVPETVWEQYKEPILQELRAGSSYRKLEKWIKDQRIPGFSPSAAQLIQIKKKWDLATPSSSITYLNEPPSSPDDWMLPDGNTATPATSSQSPEHPASGNRKRPASVDSDDSIPLEKRIRHSLELIEENDPPGFDTSSAGTHSPADYLRGYLNDVASSLSDIEIPLTDRIRDSLELLIQQNRPISDVSFVGIPSGAVMTDSMHRAPNAFKSSHGNTAIPFCDQVTYHSLSGEFLRGDQDLENLFQPNPDQIPRLGIKFIESPWVEEEFDLSALHHTADLFLASGMAVEACRLYLLLTKAYIRFRYPPKRKYILALAGASRCATMPDDLAAAEEAIRYAILQSCHLGILVEEEWLLRALAIHAHVLMKDIQMALDLFQRYQDLSDNCPEFIFVMKELIIEFEGTSFSSQSYERLIDNIFAALYFLPNHLVDLQLQHVPVVNLSQTMMDPFPARPVTFRPKILEPHEYSVLCQMGSVKECIAWVINRLTSGAGSMLSSKRFRHEFMDPQEAEVAAVFCFLWVQWLEQNGASGNTIFWASGCNGISDIETLKIVSFLILQHPFKFLGKTRRILGAARGRSWFDKDFEFWDRALKGAKHFSRKPDNIIASEFIQALKIIVKLPSLNEMQSWLPPTVSRVFADKVLETDSEAIIERSASLPYRITLTAHDPTEDSKLAKSQPQSAATVARLQLSKSVSMLAGSLSSCSDLSSMRRIARQKGSVLSSISWRTLSFEDQLSETLSFLSLTESARNRASGQSIGPRDIAEHRLTTESISSALFGSTRRSKDISGNQSPNE